MFFNGRKDVLEFHDLHALHELELVVENGVQYVRALFQVRPDRPAFEGDEKPNLLLLTNGSSTRMFAIEPKPAEAPAVAADAAPAAPANVYLSTQNGPNSAAARAAASAPTPVAQADDPADSENAVDAPDAEVEAPKADAGAEQEPQSEPEPEVDAPKAE
jgi:hypothetical protein